MFNFYNFSINALVSLLLLFSNKRSREQDDYSLRNMFRKYKRLVLYFNQFCNGIEQVMSSNRARAFIVSIFPKHFKTYFWVKWCKIWKLLKRWKYSDNKVYFNPHLYRQVSHTTLKLKDKYLSIKCKQCVKRFAKNVFHIFLQSTFFHDRINNYRIRHHYKGHMRSTSILNINAQKFKV